MITFNKVDSFQNRLNEVMDENHINQTQLSKMTNIPRTSISGYYLGSVEPNAEKILILALCLNVNPYWLLGYDVHKNDIKDIKNEILSILNKMNDEQLLKAKKVLEVMC